MKPFVVAVYNPAKIGEILPERVERRALIFNLASLQARLEELRAAFVKLAGERLPRLDLEEWAGKVVSHYDSGQVEYIAGLLRAGLLGASEQPTPDPLTVWHLGMGYAALLGNFRLGAYWASHDTLMALETRGLVHPDWRERLHAIWAGLPYRPPQQPSFALEEARRAEIEARAEQMRREAEEAKLRELQERLERETKQEALVSLIAELERELRGLPAEGVHILDRERKRRGLVLEPGWREAIEQQVRREVLRQGWEPRLRGLKRVLSRHLDEAGLAWLSEECKRLHTELESYRRHLSKSASELMETQLERARRAAVAGLPPTSGPHLTTALSPSQRRRVFQPRYTREDVEIIEQANEELLSPAAPPELITDPISGRRYWVWPDGRTSPA
jgi:hypothetical protein